MLVAPSCQSIGADGFDTIGRQRCGNGLFAHRVATTALAGHSVLRS
jgi:hypothetical protein